jgi:membrane protein required for colicin V production
MLIMNWVDIIVIILLILGLLGGLKEGALKALSSLMAMYIAVFLASFSYALLASLLSFLPYNWSNFLGFFITAGIISVLLHFVFFVPRKVFGAMWKKGVFFRVLGGVFSLIGSIISMAVFALVVRAYPVFDWLARWVTDSNILNTLMDIFKFILPAVSGIAAL